MPASCPRLRPAELFGGPGEEAGDQHRRQSQAAGPLRCTPTCAFCGKRKHYEHECYHKQRLSAKLKSENGSGKGSAKGNADQNSDKGKSEGQGKGQERGKGGRGGS